MKGPELSAQVEDTKRSMRSDTSIPLRFHRRKDGSVFPLEITATHFEWNGIPVFLCAMRDITERRRSEEALREASRKLNLLSSITRHDITNQLLILQGQLLLMKGTPGSTASSEAHLLKAEAAAQRISGMIYFTKEYEEIGVHAPIWQDCHDLIEKVAQEVPLGHVALVNQVPVGMEVYADPLISKVFYNLMDNALRHGRELTTIHFRAEVHDGAQSIICEDDGGGIAAEAREHLFERGIGKQHGMGLFLSKEILAITSIAIVENGAPGSGARFILTIPLGAYRVRTDLG
jgi:signal transduction histidine kinase